MLNGTTISGGGDLTIRPDTGNTNLFSSGSGKPILTLESTNTDKQQSAEIKFLKDADNVEDDEALGSIGFYGDNDAGTPEVIQYGKMLCTAADMTDGQEAGEMIFQVAEYDGTLTTGLKLDGDKNYNGKIDVTVGASTQSTLNTAGDLTLGYGWIHTATGGLNVDPADHSTTFRSQAAATGGGPYVSLASYTADANGPDLIFKNH